MIDRRRRPGEPYGIRPEGGRALFTYLRLACCFLRSALRPRCDVALENLALRQQLVVVARSCRRPRLRPADRLFWTWLSRIWSPWRSALVLVQPDTVVAWHRTGW